MGTPSNAHAHAIPWKLSCCQRPSEGWQQSLCPSALVLASVAALHCMMAAAIELWQSLSDHCQMLAVLQSHVAGEAGELLLKRPRFPTSCTFRL